MTPLEKFLELLPEAKQHGDEWAAKCPAHEDRTASLGLTEGRDGRVLIKCLAGCETEAVVAAVGLRMRDLFPERGAGKVIVAEYDYRDQAGELLFQVVRYDPKDFRQRRPDGAGGWIWNLKGVDRVLYRLPELLGAVGTGETVYLVEGEKDADNLARLGLVSTTNAGGVKKWDRRYSRDLRGAKVVLLPDNDAAGKEHAEKVASQLCGTAASVRVVGLPGLPAKGDVSDWIRAGGTRATLQALADAVEEWRPPKTPGVEGYQQNFEIERIEKVEGDEPIYYVSLLGARVKMSADELHSFLLFSKAVMKSVNRMPDMRNPNLNWRPYVDMCLRERLGVTSTPDEATRDAMIWHRVKRYLERKSAEDEAVLAEKRGVYSNERFFYFHGPTLYEYLSARGLRIEPIDLWEVLRRRGAESKSKRVKDSLENEQVIRAWFIAKTAVTDDEEGEGGVTGVLQEKLSNSPVLIEED